MISPPPKDVLIKIIPKQKGAGPGTKANIFLTLVGLVFVICLIVFVVLYFQLKGFETKNKELDNSIAKVENKENVALKNKLKGLSTKIDDFAKLLQEHKYYSQVFSFLRGACHPKVQLTSLTFEGKNNSFRMDGITDDFKTLGEQLLILRQKPAVLVIRLDNVGFDTNRKINFGLSLTLSDIPFFQPLSAKEREELELLLLNPENFTEGSAPSTPSPPQ